MPGETDTVRFTFHSHPPLQLTDAVSSFAPQPTQKPRPSPKECKARVMGACEHFKPTQGGRRGGQQCTSEENFGYVRTAMDDGRELEFFLS